MFGQSHLFAPNYPRFLPMGGAVIGLGRGDSSRKKNPGPPPWACEKCAKNHPREMGCDEGEIIQDPGTLDYYEVETTRDIDEVLSGPHSHRNREEQLGCKKCKEGQRKRKRAEAYGQFYNMRGLPVTNLGSRWACGHSHPELEGLSGRSLGYGHPPPAGVCCQATQDGGTVCSDGFVGPPG